MHWLLTEEICSPKTDRSTSANSIAITTVGRFGFGFHYWFTQSSGRNCHYDCRSPLSYPNFVQGLLFDGMQPLVDRLEVLGTLYCTIREVLRHAGNQKEAFLRNPWNSVTCHKSKGSIVTQSVSFRNILKAKKGVITWPVRFRNLTERKQVSLRNS